MGKRISKRAREEAALICAVAASSDFPARFYGNAAMDLGVSQAAYRLAGNALQKAFEQEHGDAIERAYDAEAESLLRCGWTP
jgi:hypothetical protein